MERKEFLKIVAEFDGSIDKISEDDGTLIVDAPKGYVWNDGCHCIVEPFRNRGGQSWKAQAYADAASRMRTGTSKCDEQDCESCQE